VCVCDPVWIVSASAVMYWKPCLSNRSVSDQTARSFLFKCCLHGA